MGVSGLALRITPSGRLVLEESAEAMPLEPAIAARLLKAFDRGTGEGLLQLGGREVGARLPVSFSLFRELAARFVTVVCSVPMPAPIQVVTPTHDALSAIAAAVPLITGSEYLTAALLEAWWHELTDAFNADLLASGLSALDFLEQLNPAWHLVGRVHFNLAENRHDEEAPFAFMATYTPKVSVHGKAQHVPLGQALTEYAGPQNKQQLLGLLLPVKRASEHCTWLKALVDAGDVFHPLRWDVSEAHQFIKDIEHLEAAGIIARLPSSWKTRRPARPTVNAKVGTHPPENLGTESLLDFQIDVSLEGESLTHAELRALMAGVENLVFLRGRWVEVDRDKLQRLLTQFENVQHRAEQGGLGFHEAMRLLASAPVTGEDEVDPSAAQWAQVTAGPWLANTLKQLRAPDATVDPGAALNATLRPYQRNGVQWLHLLSKLGLGACLADDMGLGKTIQVLALLLVIRRSVTKPTLLVAPASLLANWSAEIAKFAPTIGAMTVHPSELSSAELKALTPLSFAQAQLVMTTYGSLQRVPALTQTDWELVIVDEAQAIKNPNAKQTRAVKKVKARSRIALTGTPVENRLGDLWSIFDFINPGLLGTSQQFTAFTKKAATAKENPFGPLRELVRPYILRRLKTDKSVIDDLPDKTEVNAYCALSKKQAALYQAAVEQLKSEMQKKEGIARKGIILSYLLRFKQICNHPSQWLSDGEWLEADSGKLARLRELTEVIAAKQQKVLVFTQFRETTAPLDAFLASVFGKRGLVLHGGTLVAKRKGLVNAFQEDESVPYFVLSLKAGGSGLNLTSASHVIHFDRWWNPAVENQATDRAYRIGQKKNVLVNKFICRGTVEEKIDQLIESKRGLSNDLLQGGNELVLTELKDDELLSLVALDLKSAAQEL